MSLIKLDTSVGSSEIHIPGSIKNMDSFFPVEKTILLVDENVFSHYESHFNGYKVIIILSGERSKSIANYNSVFGKMLKYGVDRSWRLIGIGGGITTDLSGFVASTYYRGIPFGFVSTTLLGQVDAAIGGKNGINYEGYKNLIGIIRQPDFVLNDIVSLNTLPEQEFKAGFSEIVKYGFIRNINIYHYLNDNISEAKNRNFEVLKHLVEESVKVKVNIVESDVSESGERKLLNFGHTFAHAIEKLQKKSHGEAVAIGMVLAARLSANMGFCAPEIEQKLISLLTELSLPVKTELNPDDIIDAMKKDKKKAGETIQLILLKDIGEAFVHSQSISDLKNLINDLY